MQCKSSWLANLSKKGVMGARLIDKQNASRYDLQMRAMCTLMICELKCDPVFLSNECPCSQSLCEGAEPGHKTTLTGHVSGTVPPCHSEGKVVWTKSLCTHCQPL